MRAKSGKAVILLIGVLVWATGCGASGEGTAASDDVAVSLSDNGSQIELDQGETLAVSLDANPTTGFWWEVAEVEASILEQVGDGIYYMDDTEDPPPPGTGGVKVYRFRAVSAGQTTLKIVLRGSVKEDVEPVHTFSMLVVVH
jgi:inhibitor of cysteine peptidase